MGAIMQQANNTHFSPPLQLHELVPDLLPLRHFVEQLLVVVQIFLHLKNANLGRFKLKATKSFFTIEILLDLANLGGFCLMGFEQLFCEVDAV